jgi:hypothetical protein
MRFLQGSVLIVSSLVVVGTYGCPASTGTPLTDAGQQSMGSPDTGYVHDAGPGYDAGNQMMTFVPPTSDAGTISVVAGDSSTGLDTPTAIQVQGTNVYWTQQDDPGAVVGTPIAGGTVTTVASGLHSPDSLSVDSTNAYWSEYGTTSSSNGTQSYNNDGAIVQAPLVGGGTVTTIASMQTYPGGVTVNGSTVYWTVQGDMTANGAVLSVPVGGGTVSTIEMSQASPLTLTTDGTNVYWGNYGTFNNNNDYNGDGAILQAPVAGGTVVTIASSQLQPAAIAVDATNIYWATQGGLNTSTGAPVPNSGTIVKAPVGGGTPVTLASSQDWPTGLAIDSQNVYWVNTGSGMNDGEIVVVPIAGGTPATLVYSGVNPTGLALTSTGILWTDTGATGYPGQILEISPK